MYKWCSCFKVMELCATDRKREDAAVEKIIYSQLSRIGALENMAPGQRSFLEKEEEDEPFWIPSLERTTTTRFNAYAFEVSTLLNDKPKKKKSCLSCQSKAKQT